MKLDGGSVLDALKQTFGIKAKADAPLHVSMTLGEYVKDTATRVAALGTPGDFAGLDRAEIIANEMYKGAVATAAASGLSGEAGPARPVSVEEALIAECDEYRRKNRLPVLHNVEYEDGDALSAIINVGASKAAPPTSKPRGFVQG